MLYSIHYEIKGGVLRILAHDEELVPEIRVRWTCRPNIARGTYRVDFKLGRGRKGHLTGEVLQLETTFMTAMGDLSRAGKQMERGDERRYVGERVNQLIHKSIIDALASGRTKRGAFFIPLSETAAVKQAWLELMLEFSRPEPLLRLPAPRPAHAVR